MREYLRSHSFKILGILVFFIVLGLLVLYEMPKLPATDPKTSHIPGATEYYLMAHNFMKEKLSLPVSAEFASFKESKVSMVDANTYTVTSYVDARNHSGAIQRTKFVMKVHYLGNDKFQMQSLETFILENNKVHP